MAYKQQNFIPHHSRSCESEIRVSAWSGSGEDPPLDGRLLTLVIHIYLHKAEKEARELSGASFYKGTHPIHEGFAFFT